jgi:hypothetical protein
VAKDGEKRKIWRGRIKAWKASGLTRVAWCKREGICISTLDYWRRQIEPTEAVAESSVPGRALTLVPVKIRDEDFHGAVMLRSPGGWSVALPASTSAASLADLLKQLP